MLDRLLPGVYSRTVVNHPDAISDPPRGAPNSAAESTRAACGPEPWREHFPFTPRWFRLGKDRLHYVDEGNGPVLLFVHGNPTWSFHWRRLLTALAPQYRVIAFDHLGSGLSDKPRRGPYGLTCHSRHLAEFLDFLAPGPVTLVAHDWGGAIGLHCALFERPSSFERFILFNTGAFPPRRIPARIAVCRTPLLGKFLVQGLNVFVRGALSMAMTNARQLSATERAGILAPYPSWRSRRGIQAFLSDIPMSRSHPTWQVLEQLESNLHRLQSQPVHLIWGMRDWCFDVHCLDRLLRAFPHAEVSRIPEGGHWVVEDAPAEVQDSVLRFLARTTPTPSRNP